MIYVGSVLGGPELERSRFFEALKKLKWLKDHGSEGNFGSLDIVFHVPGSVSRPNFRGLRTGKFSRRERMLMIQVGVDTETLEADDVALYAFLFASLREAIRMARPKFEKAKIPFPETEYLAQVDRLHASIVH